MERDFLGLFSCQKYRRRETKSMISPGKWRQEGPSAPQQTDDGQKKEEKGPPENLGQLRTQGKPLRASGR